MGGWGKFGPSGCSVPLPAPEVWLGDSRPTCSSAPYTQTYIHTSSDTVRMKRWDSVWIKIEKLYYRVRECTKTNKTEQ